MTNAFYVNSFLPTSKTTETCLRVLIQHDPNVHMGSTCPTKDLNEQVGVFVYAIRESVPDPSSFTINTVILL